MSPLFFVRNPYASWLRDGSKTIEIRRGTRYRNVAAGGTISVNGQFRLRVLHVVSCAILDDLLTRVDPVACGFDTIDTLRAILQGLYGGVSGDWYAFHVERIASD